MAENQAFFLTYFLQISINSIFLQLIITYIIIWSFKVKSRNFQLNEDVDIKEPITRKSIAEGTSNKVESNSDSVTNAITNDKSNKNGDEAPKEKNLPPDDTAVAMSKVFADTSDLAITLSKLTEPISRVYLQDGKIFVEKESLDNKFIEHLGIRIPEYLKLLEATALFQTEQKSLNNFLDDVITNYLNDRNISIISISRDATGKFTLSDGNNTYKLNDILNYIENTQSVSFDVVNPMTNEDLTKTKTILIDFINKLQKSAQNYGDTSCVWSLNSKNRTRIIFRVGKIIKDITAIKLGESLIKKFKEGDATKADILTTALNSYYTNKNKSRTDSQVQIQFFAYLYSDSTDMKPLSNEYINKQDVLDIARDFMGKLNNENMMLVYDIKDDNAKEQVSQLHFYMGDENNILIPQGKNYVAFSLICTKDVSVEKDKKSKVGKAISGVAKGVLNTLATASGALVNSSRSAAASSSGPVTL